jgi:hypothetical protein
MTTGHLLQQLGMRSIALRLRPGMSRTAAAYPKGTVTGPDRGV